MPESNREEITKLEALYASNPEGRVFTHLAEAYRKAGDYERARTILEQGLAKHPAYASAHVVLGRVLIDLNHTDEATESFRRVLQLDPHNLVALRSLGDLARAAGRNAEALGYFEELRHQDPSNGELEGIIAELLASPGPGVEAPQPIESAAAESVPSQAEAPPMAPEPEPELPDFGAAEPDFGDFVPPDVNLEWTGSETEQEALPGDLADFVGMSASVESPANFGDLNLDESAADLPPIDMGFDADLGGGQETAPAKEDFGFDFGEFGVSEQAPQPEEMPARAEEYAEAEGLAEVEDPAQSEPIAAAYEEPAEPEPVPAAAEEPDWAEPIAAAAEEEPAHAASTAAGPEEEPAWIEASAGGEYDEPAPAEPIAAGEESAEVEPTTAAFEEPAQPEPPEVGDEEGAQPDLIAAAHEETGRSEPAAATSGGELVTETMAELYHNQGLHERAAEVYRALLRQRPDDAQLRARLSEVEAATKAVAEPVAASAVEEEMDTPWTSGASTGANTPTPYAWAEEEPEADESAPVADYFRSLLSWRPAAPEQSSFGAAPEADVESEILDLGEPLATSEEPLFEEPEPPSAPEAATPSRAGTDDLMPWEEPAAVTNTPAPPPAAAPNAAPAPNAQAGPPTGSEGPVEDAFDEWFGPQEPAARAEAQPGAVAASADEPAPEGEDDDDLEMFRSWLQSLKK